MTRRRPNTRRAARTWLPSPLLSVSLLATWLLLLPVIDAGSLVIALLVAFGVPVLCAPLRPLTVRVRHPLAVLRLIGVVGVDVITSNLDVAWGVLRMGRRRLRPAFVTVPLELREPHALAALATIATVIPGTVWCELAGDRSALRLHVFDLEDEEAFIALFKSRYERPLQRIFE